MNSQVEKLISAASSDIGYLEKGSNKDLEDKTANAGNSNFTKYGAWYGDNGVPWCAQAVSYWASTAGIPTDIIPKHESCSVGVKWFQNAGRLWPRADYTPKRGDIIYFTDNGIRPCHVGIVTNTDSVRVYTIEGNTSGGSGLIPNGGCVTEKCYPLTYSKILGYGCPRYSEEDYQKTEDTYCMIRYKKLLDIPNDNGFREIIETLMDAEIINGDGSDADGNFDVIDLSLDQVRTLVFVYRGGGFDKQLAAAGLNPVVEES